MAYGRFGGGGQSNLRSVDAGQAKANAKDAQNSSRNITIPKVTLPVKKKKKPVTIFGMKVTAPKTDMQKKIASGQATVLAGRKLDSGKTLLTTEKATGKIVSKKDQDRKILIGSSPTMQGRPANFAKKFDNAGANFSDFMGAKTGPVYKGQPLTEYKPKVKSSGLTGVDASTPTVKRTKLSLIGGDGSGVSKIDTPVSKPKINKTGAINSGMTIYDFNKKFKGSYVGTTLSERQFLKSNITPSVSSLIGGVTSSVKNIGSWWKNAGDNTLKKQKQNNARVKAQLGLSTGKRTF